jgi:oxygen-independent coproporphyrinogen-3 oxidase
VQAADIMLTAEGATAPIDPPDPTRAAVAAAAAGRAADGAGSAIPGRARPAPDAPPLPVAPAASPLGLYLHVPFCRTICHYCHFTRGLLDEALKARYVDALAREIGRAGDGSPADTIYFGGGTPSLLEADEVARLVRACREAFAVARDAEITLEMNPETASPAYLSALRAAGVTRLSLGVQSFHDDELDRLGRSHTAERARRAVADARAAGFDNISLDLMLWLPGQDLTRWLASVEALVGAAPDHASVYLLEIYPDAPLRDLMARSGWAQAPDELAADMYLAGLERLEAAGYRQYEISNVARHGRVSRHNLKYWTDGEWLGFGTAAHSTRGGVRWRNVPATGEYLARIGRGDADVRLDVRRLSRDDRVAETLITGLRLVGGVDLAVLQARYGVDVRRRFGPALAPYEDAGLVVWTDRTLRLTRQGFLLANEVLAVFV